MITVNLCRYFRIIFIHLIPCILLVGLNARLFVAMRRAQARHRRLLRQNLLSESRRLAETNMATLMLFIVVGVFLLVEVPLTYMMITMIIENTFDSPLLMDPSVRRTAILLINLIILFSYPVNFFIYCGMSQQFRQTFCQLFVGQPAAVVAGAVTQPSRFADVDDEGQNNDGDGATVVTAGCDLQTRALLSDHQVNVSSKVDKNSDVEVFHMTPITDGQQST